MASAVEALIRTVVTKGPTKVSEFNRSRRRDDDTPHPLLTGMHQPMDSELTLTDLRIEGSIPAKLDGRYIRIGPNPVEPRERVDLLAGFGFADGYVGAPRTYGIMIGTKL